MERIANFRPQSTFNKIGSMCFCVFRKKHKNTKTHRLSGAIIMLKKDKETFCQCVFVLFGEKNTKRQKHIGSLVQSYCWEEEKKWVNVFLCFPEKKHKNTKTHRLSGAILMLKKDKETFGQCVFVFFGKKHKNTKTHRLSGAILMLKKDKETFGQCVFVFFGRKKHKNTKTHWVSDARSVGGNHKIA